MIESPVIPKPNLQKGLKLDYFIFIYYKFFIKLSYIAPKTEAVKTDQVSPAEHVDYMLRSCCMFNPLVQVEIVINNK